MGRGFLSGWTNLGHLRQRPVLGFGAALIVAGAAVLSIGLVAYFNQGEDSVPQEPVSDVTTTVTDDGENLPVSIPNYDLQRTAPEPEPQSVSEPEPEPEPQLAVPLRLVIESTGVDAPVIELGMDDEGIPYVPLNGTDVAWYNFSALPGAGSNAVFAAHINWEGAQGVFGNLDEVQPGDTVRLLSEDGTEYVYEVVANFPVDPENPESLKVMHPTSKDTVTLITCGGTWVPDASEQFGGSYTNRTVVQAELVDSTLTAPVPSAVGEG